jgi:hypothetical protein
MNMKKFFMAALLMASPIVAMNAMESMPDTLQTDGTVSSYKFDSSVVKLNSEKYDVTGFVDVGFATMVNPDEGDFRLWGSWEIGFGLKYKWMPFGQKNVWGLGFGVNWRNYRTDKKTYWIKNDGVMSLTPYPDGYSNRYTAIRVFSLQVPVTYTHHFDGDQGWGITIGGIVNFNTGAHATREYEFANEEYSIDTPSIRQRPVTVDALLMVDFPSFPSIYCRYSPTKFFKDGAGPKMNQISFGLWF